MYGNSVVSKDSAEQIVKFMDYKGEVQRRFSIFQFQYSSRDEAIRLDDSENIYHCLLSPDLI